MLLGGLPFIPFRRLPSLKQLLCLHSPHSETIADGEFWPIITHADASVKRDDLYSEIIVDRGYFTTGTRTTRQVLALAEGPVIVLDSL